VTINCREKKREQGLAQRHQLVDSISINWAGSESYSSNNNNYYYYSLLQTHWTQKEEDVEEKEKRIG